MLLFEFRQYDWGEGENIEFDFVRQLIKNEAILQIHITYKYDCGNTEEIKNGFSKWLDQEKEFENWKNEIMENETFKKYNQMKPKEIKIWMEDAE